jgi:hypothetical protein
MVALAVSACADDQAAAPAAPTTSAPVTTARPAATTATTDATVSESAAVVISLRIEHRTTDPATADLDAVVRSTLTDPRGWQQARFAFRFDDAAAPYVLVLAEADEVDALCAPYETGGRYSCQNGPVVALNADRWRTATPEWTGDLDTYRQMLVNHEVGHLLGRHHPPAPQCPEPGRLALVMSQQSTELDGCLPNAWPLPEELAAAALHDEPLAPPYEG